MQINLLFPEGRPKALTLSYDDGNDTDGRLIGLMERYGVKGTFNLNAGLFSGEGTVKGDDQDYYRLTASGSRALYDHPLCEVATHGFTHPDLTKLSEDRCREEIAEDRRQLEALFGHAVCGHAYPYGAYDLSVEAVLAQAGIVYARTVSSHHDFRLPDDWLEWHPTCHHKDPKLMELSDRFADGPVGQQDGWLFYLWGHTFEFAQDKNWYVMENFLDRVARREDVWYATNMEIYEYGKAYRQLCLRDRSLTNPTKTDLWVNLDGHPRLIPAGQTVVL